MSEVNHSDRAHSDLGASSSKRWFECPGSVPLSEGIESKESVYAAEGTAAHELAERCLLADMDAEESIGITINDFEVNQEMADAVQVYLDYIRSKSKDQDVYVEERFYLDHIDSELFGTNDCSFIEPFKSLTIVDYKHGAGVPVEAVDNTQLLYYASGALKDNEVESVTMVVVQPRCDHPMGVIREWTVPVSKIKEFEEELKQRVAKVKEARKAKDPYLYTKAGEHCRFCNAAGFCKTLKNQAYEVARADFHDVDAEADMTLPDPEELSVEEIGLILKRSEIIDVWVSAVQKHATHLAEKGTKVEGFKLVKKRANRKWKSEDDVVETFSPVFGEELFEKKLLSPAKLEKIIGKESVAKHTFTPESGTVLAKESDKRPEVKPAIEQDFEDIEIDI